MCRTETQRVALGFSFSMGNTPHRMDGGRINALISKWTAIKLSIVKFIVYNSVVYNMQNTIGIFYISKRAL